MIFPFSGTGLSVASEKTAPAGAVVAHQILSGNA